MLQTFVIAGVVCIIASIVGGGLKAFGVEMPLLNSAPRQIILGIVGIIFIFFGLDWHNRRLDDKKTTGTEKNKDSSSTFGASVQEMRITTSAVPQMVRPDNETKIVVFIFKTDNTPIEGVEVKIKAPAGYFKYSANKIENGFTDSQGRFITRWKAPKYYSPHPYLFVVSAMKDGFPESNFHFSVIIIR
jgi:hypothetical protein